MRGILRKPKTLLYFKALMEREKERRAFIVTYIWVFFGMYGGLVFLYMGFYITHITLDSVYEFLNTVLIHIILDSIYRFLNKRINIY